MADKEGKIYVDIKWVVAIVVTSFIGLIAKDFYGLPSRYRLLEQDVTYMKEGFKRVERKVDKVSSEMIVYSKELGICKLLVNKAKK